MGFLNALYIIPILGVLIFLHELGHYVMARRAGVMVEEFGFGLPPRILGVKRGDTIYSINALPIGGFVRVKGEDGKSFDNDSMQVKTAGQRAKFLAAGSVVNFITAFVIVVLLVAFQGETTSNVYITQVVPDSPAAAAGWQDGDRLVSAGGVSIGEAGDLSPVIEEFAGHEMPVTILRGSQVIESTVIPREDPPAGEGRTGIGLNEFRIADIEISDVPADSAAAAAGLQDGDTITAVNDVPVHDYMAYAAYIRNNAGQTVDLTVRRDGESLTVPVAIPATVPQDDPPLGEELIQNLKFESIPVAAIPGESIDLFFGSIRQMGEGILSLVRGETPLDDLAGPIGMGQLTSEVINDSPLPLWVTIANLMFILSLNLGLLNLMPLPALDGGRLLFVLIEVFRGGRRVSPEKEGMVHFVGMVLLLTVMLGIAFLDVERLISGNSFLE
ncbi:MAG TPA: RIP metalloprotease RseP [Thermomicrobiales bacterium]|nr:RIP metalloprotease RseP [Thermomicrobiales bacterium]